MDVLFEKALTFWPRLPDTSKELVRKAVISKTIPKGTQHYYGNGQCTGLEIYKSGQARAYITSAEGTEMTLYRVVSGDICILSAACMINSITFGLNMEFEEDTELYTIPKNIYQQLSDQHAFVKDYTLEMISARFSEVMWLIEQLVFSNNAKRLAQSLVKRSEQLGTDTLSVSHEQVARDLGTAREVVTRLLRQFQLDGLVELSRGQIRLKDIPRLEAK